MKWGTAVAQWLRCCATILKVAGSIPTGVSGFFIDLKSLWPHYGPGVDSASNRNEYREYFLGGKGGRCVRLTTYHHPYAVVTKSGNLNFLEHSGPVQTCNGTALPLPFTLKASHVPKHTDWKYISFDITYFIIQIRNFSKYRTEQIQDNTSGNKIEEHGEIHPTRLHDLRRNFIRT